MRFNKLNIIGLLISMIGLIYLLASLYMLIKDIDWISGKIWIGFVLFFGGGLVTIIDSIMQKKSATKRISSNLTLFYKYIMSSIIILLLSFLIFMVFFSIVSKPDMILAWIIFSSISIVLFFTTVKALLKLKFVEFDNKQLIISNYTNVEKVQFERIVNITRYRIYFYQIDLINDFNTNRKIFIMPIITEVFLTFLISEPASIKSLKKKIRK